MAPNKQKQDLIAQIVELMESENKSLSPLVRKAQRLARLCNEEEYSLLFELHLDGFDPSGESGTRTGKWTDVNKQPKWNFTETFYQDRAVADGTSLGIPLEQIEFRLEEADRDIAHRRSRNEIRGVNTLINIKADLSGILSKIKNRVGSFLNFLDFQENSVYENSPPTDNNSYSESVIKETYKNSSTASSELNAEEAKITNSARNNKKTALILKGGGVKGLALVGAILELSKYYKFDAYVGTSAGAIVAGLLAAGCTPAQLEDILRRTDFRKFQDGNNYRWIKNLVLYRYVHPGKEFENWIWDQIKNIYNARTKKVLPPRLSDIDERLTIYAAQEGEGHIIFDSKAANGNSNLYLTFAIRGSMSIPIYFSPPYHNGKPVYDGGLLNNFPAEHWLNNNSNFDFIGVYLGPKTINPAGSGVVGGVINTIIERNDAVFIDNHRNQVIVVDPAPVETTDFDLSVEEADFLVLQGRADTLEHLKLYLPPNQQPSQKAVNSLREAANKAKEKANKIRRRRKEIKRFKFFLTGLIIIALVFVSLWFLYPLFANYWYGYDKIYDRAESYNRTDHKSIELAIQDYTTLINANHDIVSVYDNRGEAYEQLAEFTDCNKNRENAIKDYSSAIRNIELGVYIDDQRSSLGGLYLNRAHANENAGHLEAAFADFNKVCETEIKDKCTEAQIHAKKVQEKIKTLGSEIQSQCSPRNL